LKYFVEREAVGIKGLMDVVVTTVKTNGIDDVGLAFVIILLIFSTTLVLVIFAVRA
jgi:hypothetical protein